MQCRQEQGGFELVKVKLVHKRVFAADYRSTRIDVSSLSV